RLSIDTSSLHDSRRSSVDSRFASGMTHLNLNPTSPYESRNTSHVSLVTDLQRERGITSDQRPNGGLPLSPLGNRAGPRASVQPRRAPVINPNPRSVSGAPDPMAAAPTKGYAWAFPDEMERRGSSSGDSTNNGHYMSRQNSIAATSVNSSIFTTDSNMTNGRKRMREEDVSTTHHHSMQHPAISNLQNADHAAASGGSYSRTPELRYGHKMAERKRRSEMKNLFDELNSILPGGAGTKSSKWEILTKGMFHDCDPYFPDLVTAIDHIKLISNSLRNARDESVRLRPEAEAYRRTLEENQLLRNELATVWHHLRRVDPSSPHVYGSATNMLAQEAQGAGTSSVTTLPPLHPPQQMQQPMPQPPPPPPQPVRHWEQPSSGPMTGVQVQYDGMMPYDHQRR
ncbi:hypothetical protein M011DRAFT_396349, partial [Sporormia fimetaria CBS 119925]